MRTCANRRPRCCSSADAKQGSYLFATVDCVRSKEHPSPLTVCSDNRRRPLMAIDNPHRPASSGIVYVLALIALVTVIVIAATSLWRADNSGTNALSGDPQA